MRILDENDNEISATEADTAKGTLTKERIFLRHHEPAEEIPELSHWENSPNIPDSMILIIDQPRIPAKNAWDEYETILRYHPYTQEQMQALADRETELAHDAAVADQSALAVPMLVSMASTEMSDSQVAEFPALMPKWTPGDTYVAGAVLRHEGVLYRVSETVTADAGEPPSPESERYRPVGQPENPVTDTDADSTSSDEDARKPIAGEENAGITNPTTSSPGNETVQDGKLAGAGPEHDDTTASVTLNPVRQEGGDE